jgi:hypothetical protein
MLLPMDLLFPDAFALDIHTSSPFKRLRRYEMTREQGPKFSEKHGADTRLDPLVKKKVEDKAKKNEIACAVAFQIAEELRATPSDIGKSIDLLDIRLVKCQLGLFGYSPQKKTVKPKPPQSHDMEEAIHRALVDHKLPCSAAWKIAQQFKVPKMAVSSACEALKIKVKPCQLGAF